MSDARAPKDPYSRIYHRVEREFPHIWSDDKAWAAFTRMLVWADRSYPMRPAVPASVSRKVMALLTGCGLVCVEDGYYAIRGMEKERKRRSDAARKAAEERWGNAE